MLCTAPSARNSTRRWRRSRNFTRRASRCWSARSRLKKRSGVPHVVLNAKHHEKEAAIVAQAGRKAAITVSTNMAGRGTDILLGGNPEFMAKDACLKERLAETLPPGQEIYIADEQFFYFQHAGAFYRVPRARWNEIYNRFKAQTDSEHDEV